MADLTGRRLVFLDFDGVICDSLPECHAVSRIAYFGMYLGGTIPQPGPDDERTFRQLRPYIRRGGDYLFIQHCLQQHLVIGSQEDFDAVMHEDPTLDDTFHELFYKARRELHDSDPRRWYALNPLYPGLKQLLQKHGGDGDVLILSTKEADFIAKILAFNGIPWDSSRIYCSGKERKLGFIDRVMDELGAVKAVFVDDQIDHFKGASTHPVKCLLADWGYVLPGWIDAIRMDAARVLPSRMRPSRVRPSRVETVSLTTLESVFFA
jgi:phosphoglycolate phosphatase-like HAD superfamily hydrolase